MTASFSVVGENVSVSFTYEAPVQAVIDTVKMCVKNIYVKYMEGENTLVAPLVDGEGVLIQFEDLTNEQLLQVLDSYILEMIIFKAKDQHRRDAIAKAMEDVNLLIDQEVTIKYL